jgi:YD repeat-containing protein
MAILEKRKAVNKLPRFKKYQDTRAGDRAAELRGAPARLRSEAPITSAIRQLAGSSGQMGKSQGFNQMGGAGGATVDKFGNTAGQPKTAVTTALKGATAAEKAVAGKAGTTAGKTTGTGTTVGKVAGTTGTTSKLPGLTSKTTGTTGKTLTSTGTGTTKTTGAKTTGSTGSSLSKTLTSALAGAALGAGTKFVIDKLTGTKKTADTTDKVAGTGAGTAGTGAKTVAGTGLTSKTNTLGTNIGKTLVDQVLPVKKTTLPVKKITAPITKTTTPVTKTTGTTGTGAAKTGDLTSVIKAVTGAKTTGTTPKVTGTGTKTAAVIKAENPELTEDEVVAEMDRAAKAGSDYSPVPEGAVGNGDGTYTVIEDGMVTTYAADGSIIGMRAAEDVGGESEAGESTNESSSGSELTETLDDGTLVTYDASGNVVSYTDPDGSVYDPEGNILNEETVAEEEVAEEEVAEEEVAEEEAAYSGLYSDEFGNLFDAEGNFVQYADGSSADSVDTSDEYIVPDTTSDVAYTDEYGNTYDITGQMIDEGEYNVVGEDSSVEDNPYTYEDQYAVSDEYNADDEYSSGDEYSYQDDYSYDDLDYGKKGGLMSMKNGGAPVHMIEGGGASVDGDPVSEEENEDGTITQYFSDDSSITYGQDNEVISVMDAEGVEESGGGDSGDAKLQTRSMSSNGQLTVAEMNQILDDRKISRDAQDRQQIEDEFKANESLDNYRAANGLPPLRRTTLSNDNSTAVSASSQNLQGRKYFSDGSFINFDKYGTPFQTSDADGNLSFYDSSKKPTVNSEATATLARDPNYSDTTEEVQDFQNVNNISLRNSPVSVSAPPPEGWPPAGFSLNDDGSNTATYVDADGSTVTIDTDSNIVNVTDAYGEVVAQDNEPVTTTGGLAQANQDIQYFDDGSYIQTFDDGTSLTFDSNGNPFRSTDTEGNSELATTSTYDDFGNQTISDYYGNIVKILDPQGSVIPLGGGRINTTPITSAGGTGAVSGDKGVVDPNAGGDVKGAIDKLLTGLNTYGGAGAAGAVLGSLLSDTDLFGGGGGGSNFDMTGVGEISPRTTDFGIGPANYVSYEDYGTPEQMPELYGNELYQNLNAPGFNEVNPGDYERMDKEEFVGPVGEDDVEEVSMAEGGMPQGGLGQGGLRQTYYTFGTPVDPLQNLRNPKPFQSQPQMPPQAAQNAQQAPQQMPQMGMPQPMGMPQMGMPPAMRRGGLPHASNVPMTQGRMDFRRGSAVHGAGDGQSDDIPAMLADGEYVFDSEIVAQIGNGSTKAGAEALDRFRENIRAHKRSAPVNKIPPKTKALTSYLKGAR